MRARSPDFLHPRLSALSLFLIVFLGPIAPAYGEEAESLQKLVTDGKINVDVRYRYEFVDEDGKPKDAHANTVRSRVGFDTGRLYGFGVGFDIEYIESIGRERFNSTVNRKVDRPVVADPEDVEINQAFLINQGLIPDTTLKLGRQRIIWDNHRFLGNVGFRQNEQTFDSLRVINASLPDTELEYVFIDKVNRIFGDVSDAGNFDTSSHHLRAAYKGFDFGTIIAYAHLLDFDRRAQFGLSTQTYGLRFTGNYPLSDDLALLYTGEYAYQADFEDSPRDFDVNYWLGEGGINYRGVTVKAAVEALEGDNTDAFQTPLSTLHLFQGWADQFLVTPADGVIDVYVSVGTKLWDTSLYAVFHDLDAYSGPRHHGQEVDLQIFRKVVENLGLRLIYANYWADDFKTDVQKLWFSVEFKY